MKTTIEMALEADINFKTDVFRSDFCDGVYEDDLEHFAELVRNEEREACAKVCEEYAIGLERNYSEIIADKIRARGQA